MPGRLKIPILILFENFFTIGVGYGHYQVFVLLGQTTGSHLIPHKVDTNNLPVSKVKFVP